MGLRYADRRAASSRSRGVSDRKMPRNCGVSCTDTLARRDRGLGAGADVARRAGAQIVDVFRWARRRFRRHRPSRRGSGPTACRPPTRRRTYSHASTGSVVVSDDSALHPAADLLVDAELGALPAVEVLLVRLGHVVEHDEHLRRRVLDERWPARLPSRCPRRRTSAASRAATPFPPSANGAPAAASAPDACSIRRRRRAARGKPKASLRLAGRSTVDAWLG